MSTTIIVFGSLEIFGCAHKGSEALGGSMIILAEDRCYADDLVCSLKIAEDSELIVFYHTGGHLSSQLKWCSNGGQVKVILTQSFSHGTQLFEELNQFIKGGEGLADFIGRYNDAAKIQMADELAAWAWLRLLQGEDNINGASVQPMLAPLNRALGLSGSEKISANHSPCEVLGILQDANYA